MTLDQLTDDERLLLAGMVRMVACADGRRTPEEMAEFRAIADEVGRRAFDEAFRLAMRDVLTLDDALALAARLTRVDARQVILTALIDLAAADAVVPAEKARVAALAALWDLPLRAP